MAKTPRIRSYSKFTAPGDHHTKILVKYVGFPEEEYVLCDYDSDTMVVSRSDIVGRTKEEALYCIDVKKQKALRITPVMDESYDYSSRF